MKKILTWGGLAFLIFFIAYRPGEAGNVVGTLGDTLYDIASGFGDFVSNVLG